jgi:hypothetical protein
MDKENRGLLTDVEMENIGFMFIEGSGQASAKQIWQFGQWSNRARVNNGLVDLVVGKEVTVRRLEDGEYQFTKRIQK